MDALLKSKPMPLCFNKEDFLENDFCVDKFVSDCRKHATLETMREDLGLHHKVLCTSMVELINKDYADFVNLSSNLVGLDKSIKCLASPLENLKQEVEKIKQNLDETLETAHSMFDERSKAHNTKVVVRHVSSVLEGLEKIDALQNSAFQTDSDSKQIEILEKVALTFNLVQFHMNQLSELKDLDHKKAEVLTVSSTIETRLESMFLQNLASHDDKLLKILRIYAIMGKERVVEDCFSKSVVRPFMRKLITQGNLAKRGLAKLYCEIIGFIPEHCTNLLSITCDTSSHSETVPGYDFLVNAIWPEIMFCFEYLNSVALYSPGDPKLFHENYTSTMTFLHQFEQYCTEKSSISRLRSLHSYNEFLKKWNLDLYFQVRFQEIAGGLENALLEPCAKSINESLPYTLNITFSLWSNICLCWDDSVFLSPLKSQFFGLTLQLLSRYRNLTFNFLEQETEKSLETAILIKDVELLQSALKVFFKDCIIPKLNAESLRSGIEEAFQESVNLLSDIPPKAADCLVRVLTSRCASHLKLISDIPRLYRRTNREMPLKPSTYVSLVFAPLNEFLDETNAILSQEWVEQCKLKVVCGIVSQCMAIIKDVLTSIKKMEDSLKILKRARDKPAGQGSGGSVTDDDKIRRQLAIDVKHLKESVLNLGLKADSVNDLEDLVKLVINAERVS